jgi:hypothetical protein
MIEPLIQAASVSSKLQRKKHGTTLGLGLRAYAVIAHLLLKENRAG